VFVGGQAGESVTTIDQLFDCESQDLILRHGQANDVSS